jgi:hypothetical protein
MNFDAFQVYVNPMHEELLNFSHSTPFSIIKFLLGIYVAVLFLDIILLLIKRGIGANIRESMTGMNIPAELTTKKKKMRARWEIVKRRLKSANESEYKVAIIEADNIIDELVKNLAFPGENMGERLNNIPEGQIESLNKLKEAHEVRNRIIHEENFQVSLEYAKEILAKYEAFLEEFEVL